MAERRKRGAKSGARTGGGRPGGTPAPTSGGSPSHGEGTTWALDVHLTAPRRGEGNASHRIEKRKPFEVLGLIWPTEDGDTVKVGVVVEELRAQILIPEHEIPRLRKDFGIDAGRASGSTDHEGRDGDGGTTQAKTQRSRRRHRDGGAQARASASSKQRA